MQPRVQDKVDAASSLKFQGDNQMVFHRLEDHNEHQDCMSQQLLHLDQMSLFCKIQIIKIKDFAEIFPPIVVFNYQVIKKQILFEHFYQKSYLFST